MKKVILGTVIFLGITNIAIPAFAKYCQGTYDNYHYAHELKSSGSGTSYDGDASTRYDGKHKTYVYLEGIKR